MTAPGLPALNRDSFANHAVASGMRLRSKLRRRQNVLRIVWFTLLVASVCFEGLGRRYLRQVPPGVLYFSKDVILAIGLFSFGIHPEIKDFARRIYGRAIFPLGLGVLWTVLESFNPLQGSFLLALLGLRAYWLWWLSPLLIASVLRTTEVRRGAVYLLVVVAVVVCAFAVLQFGAPPDADLNTYSVNLDGDVVTAVTIESTGRARVSSTFSFITGFSDFTIIVPALLMTIGLGDSDRKVRLVALSAATLTAAVLPMSGSRAPLFIGGGLLLIIAWSAGFLFTKAGRRLVFGGFILVAATLTAFPEAIEGVYARMSSSDSAGRVDETLSILPNVAMQTYVYPWMGIGTGMQQNVRSQLGVSASGYDAEHEAGKQLIELGVPGYLLVWAARFGIAVALFKASRILKRAGRGAASGAAMGFAALTFFGSLTFDHIWQALFFIALGYILLETNAAYRSLTAPKVPAAVPRGLTPVLAAPPQVAQL
jgi:hypothetical protein